MTENKFNEQAAKLQAGLLEAIVKGMEVPGLLTKLRDLDSFKSLKEGDLEAVKKIVPGLSPLFIEGRDYMQRNLFYGNTEEVARMLVGTPLSFIYSVGNSKTGLITRIGAYSGVTSEGVDVRDVPEDGLHRAIPGTIGLWKSARRGGYEVACVSAHEPSNTGYVAIWGVTSGSETIGMKEVARQFGFTADGMAGNLVSDSKSQIKLLPNSAHLSQRVISPGVEIRKLSPSEHKKMGADCVAGFELVNKS